MHKLISRLIHFHRVEKVIADNPKVYGHPFVDLILDEFKIAYKVKNENTRKEFSSAIFFSTHHTGAMDFLTTFNALKVQAPNLKVLINNKLCALEPIAKIGIATYPPSSKGDNSKTREEVIKHLNDGGNILVYPAGKVASKQEGEIQDAAWRVGIFEIFKQHASCGVPVYVDANNGFLFYFIRNLFPKLSMLFLMRCLISAAKRPVNVHIGRATPRYKLDNYTALECQQYFRNRTYELKTRGEIHASQLNRNIRRENGRVLAGDF
jgi:putative hemolysin